MSSVAVPARLHCTAASGCRCEAKKGPPRQAPAKFPPNSFNLAIKLGFSHFMLGHRTHSAAQREPHAEPEPEPEHNDNECEPKRAKRGERTHAEAPTVKQVAALPVAAANLYALMKPNTCTALKCICSVDIKSSGPFMSAPAAYPLPR